MLFTRTLMTVGLLSGVGVLMMMAVSTGATQKEHSSDLAATAYGEMRNDTPAKSMIAKRFVAKSHPSFLAVQTATGERSVCLSANAELVFGAHRENVSDAVAFSVAQAISGDGSGSYRINDSSATATIIQHGKTQQIEITAIAPGRQGVDLRPLIESVRLDCIPNLPPVYHDAAVKFFQDVVDQYDTVVMPSHGAATLIAKPHGYSDEGSIAVAYSTAAVQFFITVPQLVPGIGNETKMSLASVLVYSDGDWSAGGTVVGSGYYGLEPSPPMAIWGVDLSGQASPGLFPSFASFKNESSPPARSIREVVMFEERSGKQ